MAKTRKNDPKTRSKSRAKAVAPAAGLHHPGAWEWDLPAGFTADGSRMATLREILEPSTATRTLAQLSEEHKLDLAAKRLEMAPDNFQVVIPGYGTLGKARAAAEVRDRSRIGRHLAEIQYLAIQRGMKFGKITRQQKGEGDGGNRTGN
jgi:hypothetical protein